MSSFSKLIESRIENILNENKKEEWLRSNAYAFGKHVDSALEKGIFDMLDRRTLTLRDRKSKFAYLIKFNNRYWFVPFKKIDNKSEMSMFSDIIEISLDMMSVNVKDKIIIPMDSKLKEF